MEKDWLKISGMHDGASLDTFEFAANLRKRMTASEKILWDRLKNKSLNDKFRRQHPIGQYILDFYCHRKRLSIELDGKVHDNKEQNEKDIERTAYLNELGISEIRFKNKEVMDDIEKVLLKIKDNLCEDTL